MARHLIISVIFMLIPCLPITNSEGIQCYKCTVVAATLFRNATKLLCSDFDYSSKYIVDCPYSTFCMKKIYTVSLQSTLVNGTARDCAPQSNIIQDYVNGRWQRRVIVEEPYAEGCLEQNDKGQRSSLTTYCYCRGGLCNASSTFGKQLYFSILAVIFTIVNKVFI